MVSFTWCWSLSFCPALPFFLCITALVNIQFVHIHSSCENRKHKHKHHFMPKHQKKKDTHRKEAEDDSWDTTTSADWQIWFHRTFVLPPTEVCATLYPLKAQGYANTHHSTVFHKDNNTCKDSSYLFLRWWVESVATDQKTLHLIALSCYSWRNSHFKSESWVSESQKWSKQTIELWLSCIFYHKIKLRIIRLCR